ncbi:hypothetical protein AGR7B_pAt0348 [Agrobacterium deltaense RV3]|nr:hypothetical protein AGR7B_pAt0348 [Agrobacterium deltaense RV3]
MSLGHIRFCGFYRSNIRLVIDLVEYLTRFNLAPLLEEPLPDDPRNLGPYLGDSGRLDPSRQASRQREILLFDFHDTHLGDRLILCGGDRKEERRYERARHQSSF